jgi:hypothetical protein
MYNNVSLPQKVTIFEEKDTEHKMSVLIFRTAFVKNIFHSKNNLAKYQ